VVDLLVGLDLLHGVHGLLALAALVAAVQTRLVMLVVGVDGLLLGARVQRLLGALGSLGDPGRVDALHLRLLLGLDLHVGLGRGSGRELLRLVVHLGAGGLHLGGLFFQVQEFRLQVSGVACRRYDLFFAEL